MGWYPLLNYVRNNYLFDKFVAEFHADTFYRYSWFLSNRYIPRRGNNTFFSDNVSTRTDLTINFDLVKCVTKNIPKL